MIPARLDRALVLAAGLGRRLRPLSDVRAKPAVPVAGEPLVRRILAALAAQGIRRAVLNLHHRPETITGVVGDGSDLGLHVRYSWEQSILGSAGGPRRALPLLACDRFFIVNGDTLADVQLEALAATHEQTGALVTLALIANPRPARYGGVLVDADWVTGFVPPGVTARTYHFVGVQLVEARAFAGLPDGHPAESVSGVYRELAAQGRIAAHVCDARFYDVGTPADYLNTSLAVAAAESLGDRLPPEAGARVERGARLVRTVVWNADVSASAELIECVVADHVRIPPGSRFRRQAIVRAVDAEPGPDDRVLGDLLLAPLDRPEAAEGGRTTR